ncbi:MAG TPA: DUF881 domain-containing protein [Candidatus Dormibacteraeota bacterium]|nr:DUF881 domain-containing protein [Candidatus Dormibacteraeota bacterium]
MRLRSPRLARLGWYPVMAATALAFGFFFATQLRSQLIPPSAQVARNQALIATVQSLESQNTTYRDRIAADRADISSLEAAAASRSASSRQLALEVADLRAHAGLTRLHGPGEVVTVGNGKPNPAAVADTSYLVGFEDIQDVINLLYQGGAEGVAVNGRRISPASRLAGEGEAVVIDQGPPLEAPFSIAAIGNRGEMETLLADGSSLGDLKSRQRDFQLQLAWQGSGDISLPAYDSSLDVTYANGG